MAGEGRTSEKEENLSSEGYSPFLDFLSLVVCMFLAMLISLAVVSVWLFLVVFPLLAYPICYFLDMRITYRHLYLPNPDEFSKRERNVFLVAFEERFGFKRAAVLQALVSFSVFLFVSLFLIPIIARYFGMVPSPLKGIGSGAAVMAVVHLHAWILNRTCVSK